MTQTINGTSTNDNLSAGKNPQEPYIIFGYEGDDSLSGGKNSSYPDELYGGDGNDYLRGYGGNDILDGGNGNDTLYGNNGDDNLNGGPGQDTASYSDNYSGVGVSVNLIQGKTTRGSGNDNLVSIENVIGSQYDDVITGNDDVNVITTLDGADRIVISKGVDRITDFSDKDAIEVPNVSLSGAFQAGTGVSVSGKSVQVFYSTPDNKTTLWIDSNNVSGAEFQLELNGEFLVTDFFAQQDASASLIKIKDKSPPVAQSVTINDANAVIQFDESIVKGNGLLLIRNQNTGALVEAIDVATGSNISPDGTKLIFSINAEKYNLNVFYAIEYQSGTILDLLGNGNSGSALFPYYNNIPPSIKVTSNQSSLRNGEVATINFVLSQSSTDFTRDDVGVLGGNLSNFSGEGRFYSATFTPKDNSTELGVVNVGNSVFANSQGEPNLDGFDIDNTVKISVNTIPVDRTSPLVLAYNPADNSTGVGYNNPLIQLIFNELIKFGSGVISIRAKSATGPVIKSFDVSGGESAPIISGNKITLNLDIDLALGTKYFVVIPKGAITDMAGNPYVGTNIYDFTTTGSPDAVAPTATFNPADAATGVAIDGNIELIFSELIQKGSGRIEIREASASGRLLESFDAANSSALTFDSDKLTIHPTHNMMGGVTYFVVIPKGAIKDRAGNDYAGTNTYDFKTIDDAPPSVNTFTPSNDAKRVSVASSIVFTFNEPIAKGIGNIAISLGSIDGTVVETLDVSTSRGVSIAGNILTIKPSIPLQQGQHYFVKVASGAITDLAGNSYAGIGNYGFTTEDTTPPTITTFNPTDGATAVAVDSNITLTFSEPVQNGSGKIDVRPGSASATPIASFDMASNTFSNGNLKLILDPSTNLNEGVNYVVTIPKGAVKDNAGNDYAGTTTYDFTTADNTAPRTTNFSPAADATKVAVSPSIILTFNEKIKMGTGSIEIHRDSAGGSVIESTAVVSSPQTVIIKPKNPLLQGQKYVVVIAPSAITDLAGNSYAGISNYYSFTTEDTTPPTVTTFSPADGASGVAASSPITLTFSESVQRGSGLLQIRLDSATGTVVESMEAADSNRLSFAGNTLTITPSATLTSGGKYFVTVASGAIKDMAGNVYAGTNTYDFMVADTTAPTVTTFAPTDGANGVVVSANIVLTFNELIQKGTGNIEIRLDSATGTVVETLDAATSRGLNLVGNGLTINPSADLLAGRHYFVTLASGTVKDMVGNAYIGTTTYDFTTADTTAPTVTTFSPADGASVVAPGSAIVLTFNEPVQKGTGAIQIRTGSATGPLVESLDAATSSNLAFVGNNMTITPVTALLDSTRYFVTVPSGAVKDTVGNAYVGTNTYDFATADTTAPTLTAFSPTDGATGVTGTANLVLTFSEPVGKGIGNIEIRSGSATGAVVETLDVATSSKLTFNGNQLTIDPTVTLDNNARYFVTIPSGAVRDIAGNAYGGTSSYDFGTVDTIAPTVVRFSPTDAATGVAVNSNIVFSFSEPIERGVGSLELKTAAGTVVETFDAATSASLGIAGNILTLNPTVDLQPNTQYVLTAASGTVKDSAGNAYAGISDHNFTTVDTAAPIVTAFAPLDGATGVARGSTIVLTFNEAVQRGIGNIEIRAGSQTGALVESFNVATSTNLRLSGNTLTLNPSADLEADTSYFVVLPAQTVKDLAGNSYAGTSRYDFTTARSHPALHNTPSNDQFTGTVGIDTVEYTGLSSQYQLQHNTTTHGWVVTGEGNDSLQSIERLQFSDKKIALDLAPSDHAGQALLFWGVLNYASINSPLQFGSVLQQFDAGQTMQEAFELAINKGTVELLAGSSSNEALARLAFRNVTGGREPGSAMVDVLVSFMDGRAAHYSQAQFLAVVAQLDSNLLHVGLTGLQQTGVEYL